MQETFRRRDMRVKMPEPSLDGGRAQQHAQGSSGRPDLILVPEVAESGSDDEMKDATASLVTLAPKEDRVEPEDSGDAM